MEKEKDSTEENEMKEQTSTEEVKETPEESSGESNEQPEAQDESIFLKERIKTLEEENSDLKDKFLRKQADFENFRRRMNKEKEDSIKYANQMVLLDIADTIDNFERAMKSAEESKDFDTFHSGVVLIEKNLVSMLENKWSLKRFDSIDEEFDPDKHQAIAVEDREDHHKAMVLEDYQRGYIFHDRVIRPAKVKVSKPGAEAPPEEEEAGDNNKEINNSNNKE